jgi:hypothetical protein
MATGRVNIKILLGTFKEKLEREDILKPTVENENLHQENRDNGVRLVNFATSTVLFVKSTMFSHRKFINTPGALMMGRHNQINHILTDRRWHSSILDVRSFREADCDTDHYLVVTNVRERLAVSKQTAQKFDVNDLISGS